MKNLILTAALAAIIPTVIAGCDTAPSPAQDEPTWIESADDQQPDVLARHLRGLDVAMVEIDHRFAELYHAGQDGNWPYAQYQVGKLQLAMDLALERRPARATSAETYFYPALDSVSRSVSTQDGVRFMAAMSTLAESCRGCHVAENVPSFGVSMPPQRRSSIVLP
ncbi:MAG: hypothetical protein WEF86_05315 [Gemmatimonadota bacterium]